MTDQPDLFGDSFDACRHGRRPADCPFCLRDDGIRRSDEHADDEWKERAFLIGVDLAMWSADGWTADQIMDTLDAEGTVTHENRAMGAVVRRILRAVPCDDLGTEPSTRTKKHRGYTKRWRAKGLAPVAGGPCPHCHGSGAVA